MTDTFPPTSQRPALLTFAEVLDSRAAALRRDECGDWAIWGSNGHIYAVASNVFQLLIGCDFGNDQWSSAKGWNSAKRRLGFSIDDRGRWRCAGFGVVTQDGDNEGAIILDRMPTKSEGSMIRKILGIPKRKHLGAEQLAALISRGYKSKFKPVLQASEVCLV
jgi:hypothetical protein